MSQLDGGRLVAKALKQEGVECIFTLCGTHIQAIHDGCIDEGINIIDVRHEQAAAHAAEGWAKVTGKPGVAVATAGPAITNTVSALANALRNWSPLILIGGRSPVAEWEKGSLQELDHIEIMKPVTRWARTVLETKRIPEYIGTAFRYAIGPKGGPVFLEIPVDVLSSRVDETGVIFPTKYRTTAKPQGDPHQVKLATQLIANAQHPVVIAGSSVWWAQAAKELQQFGESAIAPLFLNGMARGSIPPNHPLFFSISRRFALSCADVIMVIGAPLDFRLGFGHLFPKEAKVIQVDFDPYDIGRNRAIEVGITGNIQAILKQLAQEAENPPQRARSAWIERLREEEESIRRQDQQFLSSSAIPIHPLRLCKEIADFLSKEATIIGDGGDIVAFGARVLPVNSPGHWLDPGPMGCLGVGTGYAMAAKLARPGEQVLLLSGDGSFGFNAMEFDTMVRHNLPIVCVISNDGCWGQVKRYAQPLGQAVAVDLAPATRYDKMVQALGGYGELVQKGDDIRPALERAFASGLPACINVLTDSAMTYWDSR